MTEWGMVWHEDERWDLCEDAKTDLHQHKSQEERNMEVYVKAENEERERESMDGEVPSGV